MSWLTKFFSGGVSEIVNGADKLVGRFIASPEEKQKFKLELEQMLLKRDAEIEQAIQAELGAKERILVAELRQDDNYTKRARPTVIYAGLGFIFLNYCVVPIVRSFTATDVQPFALPAEFWMAWGGIVSTWVVGRSAEKRGVRNRAVKTITGSTPSIFDDAKS